MSQGFPPFPGDVPGSSPGGFGGGFGGGQPHQGGFGGGQPHQGGFGSPEPDQGAGAGAFIPHRKATSAPVGFLIPSLAMGLLGIGLNVWLTFSSAVATDISFGVVALIAWGLSGLLGIGFLSLYFTKDNKLKAGGRYSHIDWKKAVFYLTIAALGIAVVWSALDIAVWAGKL